MVMLTIDATMVKRRNSRQYCKGPPCAQKSAERSASRSAGSKSVSQGERLGASRGDWRVDRRRGSPLPPLGTYPSRVSDAPLSCRPEAQGAERHGEDSREDDWPLAASAQEGGADDEHGQAVEEEDEGEDHDPSGPLGLAHAARAPRKPVVPSGSGHRGGRGGTKMGSGGGQSSANRPLCMTTCAHSAGG